MLKIETRKCDPYSSSSKKYFVVNGIEDLYSIVLTEQGGMSGIFKKEDIINIFLATNIVQLKKCIRNIIFSIKALWWSGSVTMDINFYKFHFSFQRTEHGKSQFGTYNHEWEKERYLMEQFNKEDRLSIKCERFGKWDENYSFDYHFETLKYVASKHQELPCTIKKIQKKNFGDSKGVDVGFEFVFYNYKKTQPL
jgi:hypothetical protein